MVAKEVEVISKPRKASFFAMLLLLGAVGYSGHMASEEFVKTKQAEQNLEIVKVKQQEAEKIYQDEIKRKESLGIDINLIQASLDVFKKIDQNFNFIKILIGNVLRCYRVLLACGKLVEKMILHFELREIFQVLQFSLTAKLAAIRKFSIPH
jgi:hypothetical protein